MLGEYTLGYCMYRMYNDYTVNAVVPACAMHLSICRMDVSGGVILNRFSAYVSCEGRDTCTLGAKPA